MPEATGVVCKISVLAAGDVLLDGRPVSLDALAEALDAAQKQDADIWYYREDAAGQPPAAAVEVMKGIVSRRLRVRLSSKPDFSDTVAPDPAPAIARIFTAMRRHAAQRQLVILRPDGRQIMIPAMDRAAAPAEAVAAVERLLPSAEPRNVAVIADTSWTLAATPDLRGAARAIPFFGMLMGLAAIGHAVWIFDGHAQVVLAAGFWAADLAIVDSARLASLPANWQGLVTPGMRNPRILVHDRATFRLRNA